MSAVTIRPEAFSIEQKRHHVLTYAMLPHGAKRLYQIEHGVSREQLRGWRLAMADGDLEHGITPRHTGGMTFEEAAEIKRLRARVTQLEAELTTSQGDADRLRAAADALGKAISVMQQHGAAFGVAEPTSREPT